MAGASVSVNPRGGVQYTWKGEKSLAMFQAVLDSAFATMRQRAVNYWRNEEWTKERHPYMTGTERDSGFFLVQQTKSLRVEFRFGAVAPWTMFEEFGTMHREGHFPIRNTLDRVGYRATDIIRDAARKVGLAGGSGGGSGLATPTAHEGAGGHGGHHNDASRRLAEIRAKNRAAHAAAPTVGHLGIHLGQMIEVPDPLSHGEWTTARVVTSDRWSDAPPNPEGKSFHAVPTASDSQSRLLFTSDLGTSWRPRGTK